MQQLNPEFWSNRYKNNEFPWDIGQASPPLMEYMKGIEDKNVKILIPGCGNAHDGFELYKMGFKNVYLLDYAPAACERIKKEGIIPDEQIIQEDFFDHKGQYDIILEQTFFCAIDPSLRKKYVRHMYDLLKPDGKLIGVLFNIPLNTEHPPFGGNKDQYIPLFKEKFIFVVMEECKNSIPPRAGNELFIKVGK